MQLLAARLVSFVRLILVKTGSSSNGETRLFLNSKLVRSVPTLRFLAKSSSYSHTHEHEQNAQGKRRNHFFSYNPAVADWLFKLFALIGVGIYGHKQTKNILILDNAGLVAHCLEEHEALPPLLKAAYNGDLRQVKAQVEQAQVNVDQPVNDTDPRTAVYFAVAGGHADVVKYLAQRGANLGITDEQGQTLLHVLIEKLVTTGKTEEALAKENKIFLKIAAIILEKSRQLLFIENKVGLLPIELAKLKKNTEIVAFFQNKIWGGKLTGLSEIVGDIETALPKIMSTQGQNAVLVIGPTGSGKSTFIGYLMGRKYRAEKNRLNRIVATPTDNDEKYPKTGSGLASQTIYPEAYPVEGLDLVFCDCPGFLDNRGAQARILASIGTRLAIRSAKAITAIVVVIDIASLSLARGDGFRNLADTLGTILPNPSEVSSSIFYIMTQSHPAVEKAAVIDTIKAIIEQEASTIEEKRQCEPNDSVETKNALAKIEVLSKVNEDNVIVLDVFNEKSKGEASACFQPLQYTPIPKEKIAFGKHDGAQNQFDQTIFDIAAAGLKLLKSKKEIPLGIQDLLKKSESLRKDIAETESVITDLSSGILATSEEAQEKQIEACKKTIDGVCKQIEELDSRVLELKAKEICCKKQLRSLDTAEAALYWTEGANAPPLRARDLIKAGAAGATAGGLLGGPYGVMAGTGISIFNELLKGEETYSKTFVYPGPIPLIAVQPERKNGKIEETGKPENGKPSSAYSLTYSLTPALGGEEGGSITIHGYVEKRLLPDNVKIIQNLNEELGVLSGTLRTTQKDRETLKDQIKTQEELISTIQTKQLGDKVEAEKQKLKQEGIKRQLQEALVQVEGTDVPHLQKELKEVELNFRINRDLFEVILQIAAIVGYEDSTLMAEFREQMINSLQGISKPSDLTQENGQEVPTPSFPIY